MGNEHNSRPTSITQCKHSSMGGSAVLVRKFVEISQVCMQDKIAKINYCFKHEYIKLLLEQQKLLFEEICQDLHTVKPVLQGSALSGHFLNS